MAVPRRELQRVRPVTPEVLTQGEYAQIQRLRATAASRVAALRQDLENLESALLGGSSLAVGGAAALRPRVTLYRSLLTQVQAVPAVNREQSVSEILANFGTFGLRERSFDIVVPVTAPDEIDQTGNFYDAGEVYDGWIVNPSIDTKIDFQKMPSQNTPFVSANSRMQFQVRAQKVFYVAQNPGTVGTLQLWLGKYASP